MAAMERVLLANAWRTPLGRFDRSVNGVPTMIPKNVIARYPLPSTASIVPDDYVAPEDREEAFVPSEMTAAEMEAEINRRVNAEIAEREARARGMKEMETAERAADAAEKEAKVEEVEQDAAPPGGDEEESEAPKGVPLYILDGKVSDMPAALEGVSKEHLEALLKAENDGNTRKGAIIAIEAALEDLADG